MFIIGGVVKEVSYQVKFDDTHQGKEIKDLKVELHQAFKDLLEQGMQDFAKEEAVGRVHINHPDLHKPIIVPPQPLEKLNPEAVMDAVQNVLQSKENLNVAEGFEVNLGVAKMMHGGKGVPITNVSSNRISKRSLVSINNEDYLCLARSIAVGIAFNLLQGASEKDRPSMLKHYNNMRKGDRNRNSLQKKTALRYHNLAGVPTNRPCSILDIPMFEQVLNIHVVVFAAHLNNKVMYPDTSRPVGDKRVYLYYTRSGDNGHFDCIVNIKGMLAMSYFCSKCFQGFNSISNHHCTHTCQTCQSISCVESTPMTCRSCQSVCRSLECFVRHKQEKKKSLHKVIPSPCNTRWVCKICKKVIDLTKDTKEAHICGEWKCKFCLQNFMGNHFCHLPALPPKPQKNKFVFLDFECIQNTGVHVPNFAVIQTVCQVCENEDLTDDSVCQSCGDRCLKCDKWDSKSGEFAKKACNGCGKRQIVFKGENTSHLVGKWLFQKQRKGSTVLAHNARGYDGYFLLSYLTENSITPKVIFNGSKIMYMHIERGLDIRVLDSLNFMPMRLSCLPKAFGLTELKKGYFPHYFNTLENQNYVGQYPSPEMYGIQGMSEKDRNNFLEWYSNLEGAFDFQKEIKEYCVSDVDILRRACMKFRHLLLSITGTAETKLDPETNALVHSIKNGVDPFSFCTIASVCMGVYRSLHLEETLEVKLKGETTVREAKRLNDKIRVKKGSDWCVVENSDVENTTFKGSDIGVIPAGGYGVCDNISKTSIQWLEWESRQRGVAIRHALNGGEFKIRKPDGGIYKVDGYFEDPSTGQKTVMEFNGCFFHGCPRCYNADIVHPHFNQTFSQRYAMTQQKKADLISMGYEYVCMWEHDFNMALKTNPALIAFAIELDVQTRLEPRDTFFGGRTNAVKLYHKVGPGEKIKYVDFTSLYPTVNKYDEYPIGHPEVILENFRGIAEYFGLAKVKVLPPRSLYHPVLPYRNNGKLLFPLCKSCADEQNQQPCQCHPEKRMILGTWTTIELVKALEMGYQIVKIYEVYHWENTSKFDPSTGSSGLFSGYVNQFLKIKQMASGWPEWCQGDEAKQAQYLANYKEKEGVELEGHLVEKNPGLRSLAKLCLNR